MRYLLFIILLGASVLFAQEPGPNNTRNLCDTLRIGESTEERTMTISLDTVYDFRFVDNQMTMQFYRSIDSVKPILKNDIYKSNPIPVEIRSQCLRAPNNCKVAFYNKASGLWAQKDTACFTQIMDIYESPFDTYDSTNAFNWVIYRYDDWVFNDPIGQDQILLSVTKNLRASSWFTFAYVVDTTVSEQGTKYSYSLSGSRNIDSLISVTTAVSALSAPFAPEVFSTKVLYRQMLKFVLAEKSFIEPGDPVGIVASVQKVDRPKFSMQSVGGGVLIRGPQGEIPRLRHLNGSSISAEKPVPTGVYFISLAKGSWHRIWAKH